MGKRKGILLAGGYGSRLYPLTISASKQLLPVYDKPMIYYPLSTLMLAGISDILIITTPDDTSRFKKLLGSGQKWGIKLEYAVQEHAGGIAEAFLVGEDFIEDQNVALILGDNIFYSQGMRETLRSASQRSEGATIFGYYVNNPMDYGIVSLDQRGEPCKITEKPLEPDSNYAVTGLYFYDSTVVNKSKKLSPSKRGELEITDINQMYLEEGVLELKLLSRGTAWMDTGNHGHLLDAANFVRIIEERQGLKIACPEEIAYKIGLINLFELKGLCQELPQSSYREYLEKIIERPPV